MVLLAVKATNSDVQYTKTLGIVNRDILIREQERTRDRVFLLAHSAHA